MRAWCVRGACTVRARCVRGACAVHRDLSTVPNGVDLYALLLNHVGIAIDAISMIFMIDENLPGIGVHLKEAVSPPLPQGSKLLFLRYHQILIIHIEKCMLMVHFS